jgi:aspartyl/asparaginyl beta-hydroxylase (cupin superfamily)
MATRIPYKWNTANFAWNNNPYTWDDVALVQEVVQAGSNYQEVFKDTTKKKKFIKLICKVEGVEYKETKEIKKRQIRITDVALVAKEVLGVDIKVEI